MSGKWLEINYSELVEGHTVISNAYQKYDSKFRGKVNPHYNKVIEYATILKEHNGKPIAVVWSSKIKKNSPNLERYRHRFYLKDDPELFKHYTDIYPDGFEEIKKLGTDANDTFHFYRCRSWVNKHCKPVFENRGVSMAELDIDYDALAEAAQTKIAEEKAIIQMIKSAQRPEILGKMSYEELYTVFGRVIIKVKKSRSEMRKLLDSRWPDEGLVNPFVSPGQMVAKKTDKRIKKWVQKLLDQGSLIKENGSNQKKLDYVDLIVKKFNSNQKIADQSIDLESFVENSNKA